MSYAVFIAIAVIICSSVYSHVEFKKFEKWFSGSALDGCNDKATSNFAIACAASILNSVICSLVVVFLAGAILVRIFI